MAVVTEIVFEGMESSEAARKRIDAEIQKLERFHDRITSCRVVLQAPNHHKAHGGLFETRIHMALPGNQEVNVAHSHRNDHAHEDAYVAIRDAFAAARRQLQDKDRKLEGAVKRHSR
ncbi:MAG: ribosome-associated translation inhibitor RaiA [Alphaproteobacteria bacterium]|nr:ribosome-associated translation inhibitor RaiA [Alphaproteobacteria bacterium]